MTIRTITIMAVIAVVLIAVAVSQRKDPTLPHVGQPAFPGFMSAINDVSEIAVSTQSGAITIHRDQAAWRVREKHDYRADVGHVRAVLLGLAEMSLLEAKTRKPEFYEKLGVQDVEAEGSLSTGVTLKDAAGNTLVEAIMGHDRPAKGNPGHKEVFIRKPGDPQTWLALGKLSVEKNPGEWLDKRLVQIETKRVRRLQMLHPDETRLVLEKATPADPDYHVVDLPGAIQSQFAVNNVVSTVASLSLDDVKPLSEIPFDEQSVVTAVFETFDGLEGTVTLLRQDEKDYVKLSAAFNPELIWEPDPESEPQPDGQGAQDGEKEAQDNADNGIKPEAEVKAEIDALNKRVAGWAYVIPKFRADTLLKKAEDLIE